MQKFLAALGKVSPKKSTHRCHWQLKYRNIIFIDRDNEEAEAVVDENELIHRHIKKFQVRNFGQTRDTIV